MTKNKHNQPEKLCHRTALHEERQKTAQLSRSFMPTV